ncbi:hypothetical protein LG003_02190 [Photorhabdus kleinii]|nr:hypothetical protein [Photorhabdus kleinii]
MENLPRSYSDKHAGPARRSLDGFNTEFICTNSSQVVKGRLRVYLVVPE